MFTRLGSERSTTSSPDPRDWLPSGAPAAWVGVVAACAAHLYIRAYPAGGSSEHVGWARVDTGLLHGCPMASQVRWAWWELYYPPLITLRTPGWCLRGARRLGACGDEGRKRLLRGLRRLGGEGHERLRRGPRRLGVRATGLRRGLRHLDGEGAARARPEAPRSSLAGCVRHQGPTRLAAQGQASCVGPRGSCSFLPRVNSRARPTGGSEERRLGACGCARPAGGSEERRLGACGDEGRGPP